MATIRGTNAKNKITGTAAADMIFGLGGDDAIKGGNGNDTIKGGSGKDQIDGGAGNDKLFGEGGNDTLIGGTGADRLDGGAGIDTVDYRTSTIGVGIDLTNTLASNSGAAGDTFFLVENVVGSAVAGNVIFGNSSANTLTGGAANDILAGLGGKDTLTGGGGDDVLGPGDDADMDIVDGGDGKDTVSYSEVFAGVSVDLEANTGPDQYTSIENVIGSNSGNDVLRVAHGGTANGADGDDLLSGSTQSGLANLSTEFLTGGAGVDQFQLHYGTGFDVITDFDPVFGEQFVVSNAEFSTGVAIGGIANVISVFNGNISATSPVGTPQFIYDEIVHILYYDVDGSGNGPLGAPVAIAFLPNYVGGFLPADFQIVA